MRHWSLYNLVLIYGFKRIAPKTFFYYGTILLRADQCHSEQPIKGLENKWEKAFLQTTSEISKKTHEFWTNFVALNFSV